MNSANVLIQTEINRKNSIMTPSGPGLVVVAMVAVLLAELLAVLSVVFIVLVAVVVVLDLAFDHYTLEKGKRVWGEKKQKKTHF